MKGTGHFGLGVYPCNQSGAEGSIKLFGGEQQVWLLFSFLFSDKKPAWRFRVCCVWLVSGNDARPQNTWGPLSRAGFVARGGRRLGHPDMGSGGFALGLLNNAPLAGRWQILHRSGVNNPYKVALKGKLVI